ncbi:uncharacterized protein G2W53_035572 [Senna tora]|uniref:Uncharacterized protein n=1 Tax=Senna tora TaxID=362788 RepID=A0A834T3S2_9FABA|nr:uncharacterized protein G2W53_035572 [Senna tora]
MEKKKEEEKLEERAREKERSNVPARLDEDASWHLLYEWCLKHRAARRQLPRAAAPSRRRHRKSSSVPVLPPRASKWNTEQRTPPEFEDEEDFRFSDGY